MNGWVMETDEKAEDEFWLGQPAFGSALDLNAGATIIMMMMKAGGGEGGGGMLDSDI